MRSWICVVVLALAACANEAALGQREIAARLGYSEFALAADPVPPGYVGFFIGAEVLEEVYRTGSFTPTDDKAYSEIVVPEDLVDKAKRDRTPVTVSLCDPSNHLKLLRQVVSPDIHAPSPGEINCSPWVKYYEGRMTIEYTSGQAGVFGLVQVGLNPKGHLYAGAVMTGLLPGDCGDGEKGGVSESGMLLGHVLIDDEPDDPLLDTCVPSSAQ